MQGKNKKVKKKENYIYIYIYKFVSAKDQSILHLRLLLGNCKSSVTEKYGKFLLLFSFLYLKYQFTKKPKFYFKNVLFQKKKKKKKHHIMPIIGSNIYEYS